MKPTSPGEAKPEEEEGEGKEDRDTNHEDIDDESNGSEEKQQDEEDDYFEIPSTFMFGVSGVPLDKDLLNFAKLSKKGKGGKSSRVFNLIRGRYIKPIFPVPGQKGMLGKKTWYFFRFRYDVVTSLI